MGHNKRVPVDVVSIGEGLRELADLFMKHPREDAGQLYPTIPLRVTMIVQHVEDVEVWANLLGTSTTTAATGTEVITRARAQMSGIEFEVFHFGGVVRELRRPVAVTPDIEAVES